MIPGAAIFAAAPLAAAGLVYFVRGWKSAAVIVAMLAVGALALFLLWLPLGPTSRVLGLGIDPAGAIGALGRTLRLETDDRPALMFMYLASFFLFGGGLAVPTPRAFLPAALCALSALSAALFVTPFVFATAFLEAAAILAVLMLSDDESPRATQRGALRFLIFVTFSVPFILLTGWLLELYSGSPDELTLLSRATGLLAAGFVILLAVVPFHSWIPAVAQDASPFAAAFMFTVVQASITFFMLGFLNQYSWLGTNPQVYAWLRLAGLVMVIMGGAFAFAQRSFGRLMGYAVIADYGATLLAIGLDSADGLRVGIVLIALRGIALAVWGIGMGALRPAAGGGDDFGQMRGLGWKQPLAAAAVFVGGLSLVGFPLTAGFVGRWALWRLLAPAYPEAAIIVLLSAVSVGLAYARGLASLMAKGDQRLGVRVQPGDQRSGEAEGIAPERRTYLGASPLSLIYFVVGLAVIAVIGLYPQWLLPAVAKAAEAFANLAG
ncbi:MAG: hypothetical protein HY023_16330 [Chloroflexi bacterium]|nr:hypothetical protein [Chloroflexota bacterium]